MREQSTRPANKEHDDIKAAATTDEAEIETKFAGGKPPPVGGAFKDDAGTSMLAFEEDANERELKQKVSKLVTSKFAGDYKKAFTHYDSDKDGAVSKGELVALLSDAGVGNGMTRGVWASKIIEKLDGDGDAAIQWREFESVFHTTA